MPYVVSIRSRSSERPRPRHIRRKAARASIRASVYIGVSTSAQSSRSSARAYEPRRVARPPSTRAIVRAEVETRTVGACRTRASIRWSAAYNARSSICGKRGKPPARRYALVVTAKLAPKCWACRGSGSYRTGSRIASRFATIARYASSRRTCSRTNRGKRSSPTGRDRATSDSERRGVEHVEQWRDTGLHVSPVYTPVRASLNAPKSAGTTRFADPRRDAAPFD